MTHPNQKSIEVPGSEISDGDASRVGNKPAADPGVDTEYGLTRERVNELIARSLHPIISSALDTFVFRAARIVEASAEKDHVKIMLFLPFRLPPPDYPDEFRIDELLVDFSKYLLQQPTNRKLANHFYKELILFLSRRYNSAPVQALLEKSLALKGERRLAGRPRQRIQKKLKPEIARLGSDIFTTLQQIQKQIDKWSEKHKQLNDAEVRRLLLPKYPVGKYPWIKSFLSISDELPRTRYVPRTSDDFSPPENADGRLPSPRLSHPNSWSAFQASVKTVQDFFFRKYKRRFRLQSIRKLLSRKKSSPSKHQ